MITYWIAAKRPMGSKTWTLHPEVVISTDRGRAMKKMGSMVTIPEDQWVMAKARVPENMTDEMALIWDDV